jgi:hypothetical protein
MTKQARVALLRERAVAVTGWKPLERVRDAKKARRQQREKRAGYRLIAFQLSLGAKKPGWVKAADVAAVETVATKRVRATHALTRIAEIFDQARAECRDLREVSAAVPR